MLLPVGISFYTFKSISYLIDVYRSGHAERSFLRFGAYLCCFPQIVSGPIMRYGEMEQAQQFGVWKAARAEDGLKYIIAGLGMKVLLADRLGFLWNDIQTIGFESISTPLAWLGAAAYSMELYFDFAGYSLIAVGIGRMIGLPAIKNFDQPYSSRSVSEFYRRWHMTLGSWFRDYLYIPLGGNRKGTLRTVFNLLLVWAVTGFWHGGGLHFILWGMILGLLVVIEKLWIGKWLKKSKILSHAYVLFVIPLTWMVFAIPTLPEIGVYFARLFPFFGVGSAVNPGDFAKELTLFIPELVGGIMVAYFMANVVMYIMELGLMKAFVRMVNVKLSFLFPAILMVCVMGVLALNNRMFDVWMMMLFGVVAYVLEQLGVDMTPIILGFILGPMIEKYFRSAMIASSGMFLDVFTRPISCVFMIVAVTFLLLPLFKMLRCRQKARKG